MSVQKTIDDFTGYLDELATPDITPERVEFITREAIACDDLLNYSAEVVDLDSPPVRSLDKLLSETHFALRKRSV